MTLLWVTVMNRDIYVREIYRDNMSTARNEKCAVVMNTDQMWMYSIYSGSERYIAESIAIDFEPNDIVFLEKAPCEESAAIYAQCPGLTIWYHDLCDGSSGLWLLEHAGIPAIPYIYQII